jgi:hypothetical protein
MLVHQGFERRFVPPSDVTFQELAVREARERPFAVETVDLTEYDRVVCIGHR